MGAPTTANDRKRESSSASPKDTGSPLKSPANSNASYIHALGNLDLQYSSIATQFPPSHADWSFDPWEEPVGMFTNRQLVDAILFTDDWFTAHGVIELDFEAYKVREKRLETERQARIAVGHLWLKAVHERKPEKLYQTIEGANGAFDVVELANDDLVWGPVRDLSGRPIMTPTQFQAFLKAHGVPTVHIEDYQSEMAALQNPAAPFEFADAGVPSTSSLPIYGLSGAVSLSDPRSNLLQDPFSLRNFSARQGGIGEAYLGSSREAGYGAFMMDYNKIPWTHPTRGIEQGNYPLVDFRKWFGGGGRPEWSAKTRSVVDPNPFVQYDTYLTGMAQMMNMEPGYRGFTHYMNNAGGGRTAQQVRDQLSLRINADDVASFRQFVSDPFRQEMTPTGQQSRLRNYQRVAMSRIYDGILQDRPFTLQDGRSFNSVAALDAALSNNSLTAAQHRQALIDVGQGAAAKVGEIPDLTANVLGRFNAARMAVPNRMSARDVRRVVSPEFMFSLSRGGGWGGDFSAARSYGFKGAGLGAAFGIGHELYDMATDDKDNPDAFYRLARAGGREGLRGGLTSGTESIIASRTSQYLLQRGLSATSGQALALGLGKRAVPGLVDMGFEGYNIATESRSHRPREVGYRLSRAFVIGASSAWAGAAAGAAIGSVVPVAGTIVGFVVGLLVGALVGFIMNEVIPNYENMVMEQVPLKEFEKNVDQQSAGALQGQGMAIDEMKLMQQVATGPEWRGPHNMREMYMRRNLSHSPGDRMFMESMMAGDIRSGCGECHARKAGSEWNAKFEPGNPALMSPVERMYLARLENEMTGRGKFLDWEVEGDTVDPAIAQILGDDPTAVSIINSVNAIQPNFREWQEIMGPKGRDLVPQGAMNSPLSAETFKGAVKGNIDAKQWYFELIFNEVGEAEYKIYRDNIKKAEEEQKKKNAK